MKKNCWLFLGAMLSTSLLAQQVTNSPPAAPTETPAPAAAPATAPDAAPAATGAVPETPVTPPAAAKTNAPAAKSGKKKSSTKKKAEKKAVAKKKPAVPELKTMPLVAGPAVVEANNVNVRGQPALKGEVISRLTKGQSVTVVEEIVRNNSGPDEPSAWAKILLPSNVHVWVNTGFIDSANKTVVPKKLNLRGGPGENYSVLGVLPRGEAVKEIGAKGDWTEIEAPTNAYAFVAAQYLKQEAPGAPATSPAEPSNVTEPPAIAAASTETTGMTNATAEASAVTNAPAETTAATEPAAEEPPPKRIVQREGVVRGTVSIQAPSHFALVSPDTGRTIDYLYTSSANLDLRRYKGLRIIVTGEEGLDERWGNTPIITIQKIQVLE